MLLPNRFSSIAGFFAITVGVLVLAGWTLDIEVLKGAGHRITMKPNAAVALIACGVALSLIGSRFRWRRLAGAAAALVAGAVGAMTFSQHLFGWNLGIDELLFREPPGAAATASPGRMGPNASLSLTLAGCALVLIHSGVERAIAWAQGLGVTMAAFAAVALIGYLFGAQELYSAARYTGIAWHTGAALLVIALGIVAARRDVGITAALASAGPGGIIARRMLLPAILVPLTFGYLRLLGERAGLYDSGLGGALVAVLLMSVFVAAIWRTAIKLDEANRAREAALRERDDLLVRERTARAEAERASRSKDDFLATLSHELRTPLNAVVGWADMLRSAPLDEDRRAHAAEVIARNGHMLARLVEDLLDVSRILNDRLRLNVAPVDLAQVAARGVEALEAAAHQKGVRVRSHLHGVSTFVLGDAERLQQIVANLLSNALKFTPPGGTIEVAACARGSLVDLTIRDTGQGIDPSFLPKLFERFQQQDNTTTREHGGLGLGLSIVRGLVELHGGTVSAASEGPGRGSTFLVTVPAYTPAAVSKAAG